MNDCKIVFKEFDNSCVEKFIELSKVEYKDSPTVTDFGHVDWKFNAVPDGKSLAVNLVTDENIVGRVMLQPRTFVLNDKELPIAFVTDALVHPEYRRPVTNFISLITSVEEAKKFSLILHTSNENTEVIYSKLLRFKNPFSLSGHGFILSFSKFLSNFLKIPLSISKVISLPYRYILFGIFRFVGLFSNIAFSTINPTSERVDKICKENSADSDPEMLKNFSFLRWRFTDAPLWKAKIYYLFKKDLCYGYIVLRNIELEGLNFTMLMDFSLSKKLSFFGRVAIRWRIIFEGLNAKSDFVFTMLNPNSRQSKRIIGFPFIKIPDKYLPHKTPIFVHANDKAYADIMDNKNLHITLGDLDYF